VGVKERIPFAVNVVSLRGAELGFRSHQRTIMGASGTGTMDLLGPDAPT
jgi:hypothetical protein